MRNKYFLYLVDGKVELITKEDAVSIKLINPKLDIWNATEALDMEPVMLDTENDTSRNF